MPPRLSATSPTDHRRTGRHSLTTQAFKPSPRAPTFCFTQMQLLLRQATVAHDTVAHVYPKCTRPPSSLMAECPRPPSSLTKARVHGLSHPQTSNAEQLDTALCRQAARDRQLEPITAPQQLHRANTCNEIALDYQAAARSSCPCSAVPIHEGNLEDLNEILHSVHVQSFPSTTNLEDLNEILLCVRVQPLPSTKAT